MTRYEEVEYECKKSSHYFHDSDYSIRPVAREVGVLSGCELGFVSNMKFKKLQFDYGEKPICFLPPSGYLDVVNDSLSDKSSYYTYIDYIQKFIDYLYDTKSRENITKFSKERIEVLLNEFLENTKEEQYFHKKDRIVTKINTVKLSEQEKEKISINDIQETIIIHKDKDGNIVETKIENGYLDIGLNDTIKDLRVNFLGALIFSIFGFLYVIKRDKYKFIQFFLPQKLKE